MTSVMSQLQSSGLLVDKRNTSDASSSPLPPAKLDVNDGESKQQLSPLPDAQSLSSAMPDVQQSSQNGQEDDHSREVSPLAVPSSSEGITTSDAVKHQNSHLYQGNFPATAAWVRHEQHSFGQPVHQSPSPGHSLIQTSQPQPIPQGHVQVHSQRPQFYLQAPPNPNHLGHQPHANNINLSLPFQNHSLYTGHHQNRGGRPEQHPRVYQNQHHQAQTLEVYPHSAGLMPYSPLFPSPEDFEYQKHTQSLQEGQFASMQAMQAANAACYSPVYQTSRFSVSPAPPSSMMQERNPFQMAPASAPHRVKRKSGGYQPYYIPSQQTPMQSQVQLQSQPQAQSQVQLQMSQRRPPPPPISVAMKQETFRKSPEKIQPSSITIPTTTSDVRQGAFANQQGPHYGRLPDGSIIELYPAMMRTMHACEYCRSRKAKCSGGNPCERCEKRDVECVYAQFEKTKKHRARKSIPGGGLDQHRSSISTITSTSTGTSFSTSTSTSGSGSGSSSSHTSGSRMPPMDSSMEVKNDFLNREYPYPGMSKQPVRRSPRFATFDNASHHEALQGLDFSSTGPYQFEANCKVVEGTSRGEQRDSPRENASGSPLMPTLNSTTSETNLLSPSSTTSSSSAGSDDYKRVKGPLESSEEVSTSHETLGAFSQGTLDRNDTSTMLPSSFPRPERLIRSVFQ